MSASAHLLRRAAIKRSNIQQTIKMKKVNNSHFHCLVFVGRVDKVVMNEIYEIFGRNKNIGLDFGGEW